MRLIALAAHTKGDPECTYKKSRGGDLNFKEEATAKKNAIQKGARSRQAPTTRAFLPFVLVRLLLDSFINHVTLSLSHSFFLNPLSVSFTGMILYHAATSWRRWEKEGERKKKDRSGARFVERLMVASLTPATRHTHTNQSIKFYEWSMDYLRCVTDAACNTGGLVKGPTYHGIIFGS